MTGRVMKTAGWLIKCITFDGHGANLWIRDILFGQFDTFKQDQLQELEWFQELEFRELPTHVIPNLPLRLCFWDGSPVWALPGVCHAVKNVGGQINSPLRTIMMGQFMTDTSPALAQGMPPSAYTRSDPMSDALHSMMMNPYFVITSPAPCLQLL